MTPLRPLGRSHISWTGRIPHCYPVLARSWSVRAPSKVPRVWEAILWHMYRHAGPFRIFGRVPRHSGTRDDTIPNSSL